MALTKGCGDDKTLVVVQATQGVEVGSITAIATIVTAADVRERLPDSTFTLEGVTLSGFT